MKLLLSTLALMLVSNVQEASAAFTLFGDECSTDADCKTTHDPVPACCGTATKDANYKDTSSKNFAKAGVRAIKTTGKTGVCNFKYSKTLVVYFNAVDTVLYDAVDADVTGGAYKTAGYTFICASDAVKTGS